MSYRRAANGDEQFESMMRELLRRVDRLEGGYNRGPGSSFGSPLVIFGVEIHVIEVVAGPPATYRVEILNPATGGTIVLGVI